MYDSKQISRVLNTKRLGLPSRVVRLVPEPHIDSTGDESVMVWVLLDDHTSDPQRSWQGLKSIDRAIHEALSKADIPLWPYVRFCTESEYQDRERAN